MKSLIVLLSITAVLLAVVGAIRPHAPAATPRISEQETLVADATLTPPPPPPATPTPQYVTLPPFPAQFSASYRKFEMSYGNTINSTGVIYHDLNNLRCRMSSKAAATQPYYNLEQLAIFRPPYAQPNSGPSNLLTLFNYGPYGVPSKYPALWSCRTSMTYFQSQYPFPPQWFNYGNRPNVGPFWDVPYYLLFNGTTIVNNQTGLLYTSSQLCNIYYIGVIPCISYVISPITGLPLQTINAKERRPNSYESDMYTQMDFLEFQAGQPDESHFELPSNWVQTMRNFNNALNIERAPGTSSSIVTASAPLNFTISLRTVPQAGLGVVTVNLFISPNKENNCTDCVRWSPSSFNFDTHNWATPQTLTLTYVKDGKQRLDFSCSGGGYDFTSVYNYDPSYYMTLTMCNNGTTGVWCNQWGSP